MVDTRRHILLNIRDQTKVLQSPHSTTSTVPERWRPQQWWESFNFLFINCGLAGETGHDDLLFFVKSPSHPAGQEPPVFVKRKAKQLPEELQLSGQCFGHVDWAQTLLLNMVLQSQYQLTVVACRRDTLPFVAAGRVWSDNMITVTKPVYASTTVTAVNLDSSRADASNPQPCYPDICFAVDNFGNAFEELVLEDQDKCYCVVLHAVLDQLDSGSGAQYPDLQAVSPRISSCKAADSLEQAAPGSQLPPQQQQQQEGVVRQDAGAAGNNSSPATHMGQASTSGDDSPDNWQISTGKRTLFAGYVSFEQIQDFLDNNSRGRGFFDALRGRAGQHQRDKVVMTGPGGMGRCEVAVTKLGQGGQGGSSSSSSSTPGQPSSGSVPAVGAATQEQAKPSRHGRSSSNGSGVLLGSRPNTPNIQQQQQQHQRGLLQLGMNRVRMVVSGVQQTLSDLNNEGNPCSMVCALMLLRLPVHHLAQELLDAL